MKKWQMESIVSTGDFCRTKLVIPAEDHMYGRLRNLNYPVSRESVLIAKFRKISAWIRRIF